MIQRKVENEDLANLANYRPVYGRSMYTGRVIREIDRRRGEEGFSGRKLALGMIKSDTEVE